MSKYSTLAYSIYHFIAKIPPKIRWSKKHTLSEDDKLNIAEKLASDYYVILVGSKTHLSSVLVSLLSWIKTGRWARYSHVLMNCDNITDPTQRDGYKFVEAIAVGVTYSTFDQVFDCDSVCLLSPKNISKEEWTKVIDTLVKQVGRPYDDLFDLVDSSRLSCVEVVLDALKEADYAEDFKNLDAAINKTGNLVPQMYRECPDFEVEIEL